MDLSFGYRTIIYTSCCCTHFFVKIHYIAEFTGNFKFWKLLEICDVSTIYLHYLNRYQIQLLLNLRHEKYYVPPPPHKFAAWAMRTNYLGFTLIYIIKHSMYLFFHLSFQFHFTTVWKYTMASSVFLKITESIPVGKYIADWQFIEFSFSRT